MISEGVTPEETWRRYWDRWMSLSGDESRALEDWMLQEYLNQTPFGVYIAQEELPRQQAFGVYLRWYGSLEVQSLQSTLYYSGARTVKDLQQHARNYGGGRIPLVRLADLLLELYLLAQSFQARQVKRL